MAILIVCAGFTVGGMSLLEEYFDRTRPRVRDPVMHRVYLTRVEKIPFDLIGYWSPVLVIAGIATAWILVLQKRRRDAGTSS